MKNFFMRMAMKLHVFLYKRTNGSMGGSMGGSDVLLLSSTGRKTGKTRIAPLLFMMDSSNYIIIASYGGSDNNPAWYHNLRNSKETTIRVKEIIKEVNVTIASKDERNRLWPIITEWSPQYAKYQEKTSREIPIIILSPKT